MIKAFSHKRLVSVFVIYLFIIFPFGLSVGHEIERFVSVQTKNIWTQLLLDTKTGKVWQISKTEDGSSSKIPINVEDLVDIKKSFNGRFRLNATENMFNYILIDSFAGDMWRCQFSLDKSEFRYIQKIK